jgi:hypothetical protein
MMLGTSDPKVPLRSSVSNACQWVRASRLAPGGPQAPPARRCVCLWIGTPRRAGPPYGLPAQASSGIGGFRTPNVRPPRVKGDVLTLQNQGTFQLCVDTTGGFCELPNYSVNAMLERSG